MDRLEIRSNVGQPAVDRVDDILFRHQLDEATAAAKIEEPINELQRGLEKTNQIQQGLKGTIDEPEVPTDRVLLRVYFADRASIENVTQLKEWSQLQAAMKSWRRATRRSTLFVTRL